MKKLLLFCSMLISAEAFACICDTHTTLEKYQSVDFIATATVLRVEQDKLNEDYHNLEIRPVNVYKGRPVSHIKVASITSTSCAFLPDENTTWLIFASKDEKSELMIGFCSGSFQIDRQFDLVNFPGVDKKYKRMMDLKLEVLCYLKTNKFSDVNKFDLRFQSASDFLNGLKGFEEIRKFAVYELTVNEDLLIERVKPLREFKNKELSGKLLKGIRDNLRFDKKRLTTIPEKTKVIVIYFYYPPEDIYPSFISSLDV